MKGRNGCKGLGVFILVNFMILTPTFTWAKQSQKVQRQEQFEAYLLGTVNTVKTFEELNEVLFSGRDEKKDLTAFLRKRKFLKKRVPHLSIIGRQWIWSQEGRSVSLNMHWGKKIKIRYGKKHIQFDPEAPAERIAKVVEQLLTTKTKKKSTAAYLHSLVVPEAQGDEADSLESSVAGVSPILAKFLNFLITHGGHYQRGVSIISRASGIFSPSNFIAAAIRNQRLDLRNLRCQGGQIEEVQLGAEVYNFHYSSAQLSSIDRSHVEGVAPGLQKHCTWPIKKNTKGKNIVVASGTKQHHVRIRENTMCLRPLALSIGGNQTVNAGRPKTAEDIQELDDRQLPWYVVSENGWLTLMDQCCKKSKQEPMQPKLQKVGLNRYAADSPQTQSCESIVNNFIRSHQQELQPKDTGQPDSGFQPVSK